MNKSGLTPLFTKPKFGCTGKIQLAEYHDDKMDKNSYGGNSDYYENGGFDESNLDGPSGRDSKIDEYGYGGDSDYYENGGFDESNLDGRPQRPRFVGRPQGQGGFVGRPQRSENYGDDNNEQYEYEGVDESNLEILCFDEKSISKFKTSNFFINVNFT